MTFEIPGWVLSNVGGFVGFGIFSILFVKGLRYLRSLRKAEHIARKEQEEQNAEKLEEQRRWAQRGLKEEKAKKAKKVAEKEQQKQQQLQLLPEPWRLFYDYLHGPEMSREMVLLAAVNFDRDVDIPTIAPNGFEIILHNSYYNLGGEGNCREEFVALFGEYVEFPFGLS